VDTKDEVVAPRVGEHKRRWAICPRSQKTERAALILMGRGHSDLRLPEKT
jgi:hypothetical protein